LHWKPPDTALLGAPALLPYATLNRQMIGMGA